MRVPFCTELALGALVHAGVGVRHRCACSVLLVRPDVVAQVSLSRCSETDNCCNEPSADNAGQRKLLHGVAFFLLIHLCMFCLRPAVPASCQPACSNSLMAKLIPPLNIYFG
jgi:hypothetical protein